MRIVRNSVISEKTVENVDTGIYPRMNACPHSDKLVDMRNICVRVVSAVVRHMKSHYPFLCAHL